MRHNSFRTLKLVSWASAGVLAVALLFFVSHLRAKRPEQSPAPPVVEVAQVEQRDVPIYGEWIGTLTGQVNADVKAQVTGYLLTQNYNVRIVRQKGTTPV